MQLTQSSLSCLLGPETPPPLSSLHLHDPAHSEAPLAAPRGRRRHGQAATRDQVRTGKNRCPTAVPQVPRARTVAGGRGAGLLSALSTCLGRRGSASSTRLQVAKVPHFLSLCSLSARCRPTTTVWRPCLRGNTSTRSLLPVQSRWQTTLISRVLLLNWRCAVCRGQRRNVCTCIRIVGSAQGDTRRA